MDHTAGSAASQCAPECEMTDRCGGVPHTPLAGAQVRRGVCSRTRNKVKCVIMTPNIEESSCKGGPCCSRPCAPRSCRGSSPPIIRCTGRRFAESPRVCALSIRTSGIMRGCGHEKNSVDTQFGQDLNCESWYRRRCHQLAWNRTKIHS